jgi:hypothetical protein
VSCRGGDRPLGAARAEGPARLPGDPAKLPPSDPLSSAADILFVAFPRHGFWAVRRYRWTAAPKEAKDLARSLGVRSSFDGRPIESW